VSAIGRGHARAEAIDFEAGANLDDSFRYLIYGRKKET